MDLVKNAVQTTAVLTLVCGALLTVVGMLITGPILDAIGMPAEATEEAAWYLRIYFAGSVFFLAYNFGSAVLRAKGDTRRPLYALAAAMLLNVVLNVIAVTVFNAGVIGIAIATDISNALSAAIVIRMLLHEEDAFRLEPRRLAVDRKALKMILYIGLPSGLQSMVFSFSNVIIQAAINSFGADSTAGSAATMNYEYYTYFFVSAFSQAAVTFIGQNSRRRQPQAMRLHRAHLHGGCGAERPYLERDLRRPGQYFARSVHDRGRRTWLRHHSHVAR